jgi:hypothetical protein
VLQLDSNHIQQLPEGLLVGCVALHTLSLHENPITPQQLEASPGFEEYNARRRGKYDKVSFVCRFFYHFCRYFCQ